jgi:hypothetical protein
MKKLMIVCIVLFASFCVVQYIRYEQYVTAAKSSSLETNQVEPSEKITNVKSEVPVAEVPITNMSDNVHPAYSDVPPILPPSPPLIITDWNYSHSENKMKPGNDYFAELLSSNIVEFDSPYDGQQHAMLIIRDSRTYGKDIIFQITQGQLICSPYNDCKIKVRFDDKEPMIFRVLEPDDHSTVSLFIQNYNVFMKNLKTSKHIKIQPNVYMNGNPVFEFNSANFNEKDFKKRL